MTSYQFLFFFNLIVSCICGAIDQASFYGNSYISIPMKEAKSSTDIHFKLKTHLANALILLVAGTTDYCIIELEHGSIKMNINLGAGETEIVTPSHIKFNDLKWHTVSIQRRDANLSLIVDKLYKVQKILPGKFFELNINYGIFVGDNKNKNNTDIFFGHVEKFRGCISDLKYNDVMILEQARYRQSQALVQGITWNCAAEFEATNEQPISFVEENSYMVMPQKANNKEMKIQFEIKTVSKDGVLLYNTGHKLKSDFFLLEINNHYARLVIKMGDKMLKLLNKNFKISDGNWHMITLKLTPTTNELIIDGKKVADKNSHGRIFQFTEISYLGGLEISKRFRATQKGCSKSCDSSFKGCIKDISIQNIRMGFPQALITEGLLSECVWQYPCLQNPCSDNSVCIQQGLDSFKCKCQEEFCVNVNYTEGYKVFSKSSLATDLEILSVEPLDILEGKSEVITTKNLHVILDYQKYGIKEAGVTFYIVEAPIHGSIALDIWPHERNLFSLSDIAHDKVHYVHDGSEMVHDNIVLDVEFSTDDGFILPEYLQGKFRFSLAVNVIPVNDLPFLDITNTTVFRTVQGTKKVLPPEIFKAVDADNSNNELVYTIMRSDGFFEKIDKPSHKITSFTQEDVDQGRVLFFDRSSGTNITYISIQVSDGVGTSEVYQLKVSVSPQYWRMEKNTGLIVLHQTYSLITPNNLSFTSNVAIPDYSAHFAIVKKPHYGVIEVEKDVNYWEMVDRFTGNDLKQHRVRYRHINDKPDFDEFQFRTLDKIQVYTFRITFIKCTLYLLNKKHLTLSDDWERVISMDHLSYETKPVKALTSINYVISRAPQYGYLFSSVTKYQMRRCDMFSQEDVASQNIKYRLFQKGYSDIEDNFSFVVLSPGCNNVTGNLTIKYAASLADRSKVNVNLRPLEVDEGQAGIIDPSHLYLHADFVSDLIYNVTLKPKHGFLQINNGDMSRNNTDQFSLSELKNNNVYYTHDGSETQSDAFTFLALCKAEDNFQYVGNFELKINLKNDNSPVRLIEKIFQIVVGGDRPLTGKDLKYIDEDLGTPISSIVYTCRESSNGYFYNINSKGKKITEFSQEDLDNNKIVFQHKGPEYGKVRLWVTDGKFHVNGILEIQASAPFIHIVMNKKIVVQHEKMVVLSSDHLTYSTNLYAYDADVNYEVIKKPMFGKVIETKTGKALKNFTQTDINNGEVAYLNEHSGGNADEIELRIRCRDAINVSHLGVWMLPSNYWDALEPKNLKMLSVEEATSVLITKDNLEVSQQNVPPSSIIYHIVEMPESGYITILSETKNGNEPLNVVSFSQDLVNDHKVLYIQSGTNQTHDKLVINVTNGIVWRANLHLDIEIIPERLLLDTNNLLVNEGGVATVTVSHIFVVTEYYKAKINLYTIESDVTHGCIQVHKRCLKSKVFSHKELQAGLVQYSHDGTENLEDQLVFTGEAAQKSSFPVVLKIIVQPVNDQRPRLVNNTGLIMWEGGIAVITNSMLASVDGDLPKEILKYQVQSCWWGTVSLTTNISNPTNFFTQNQIDNEMVFFRHQNGTEGRFAFNVSDGLHTTKDYLFQIKTKPVSMKLISKPLHIFPLQKKYVTSSHLLTVISDRNRTIYYDVTVPPSLGRLMMESERVGIFKIVSTFTQNDLNSSKVFYEHTHQFSDLYANDSFTFNVRAHLAPKLTRQVLKIDISVSSGGLDAYVNIPKVAVDEGGMTNIPLNLSGVVLFLESHAGLRAPIIHASTVGPMHGQVFLQNSRNQSMFTQQQLEAGEVYYEHDHSDSLGDNIYFSLYLIPGYIPLCNVTVPVIVNPVNDQPFTLVTPAPSLIVVQGENHTISKDELSTEDADTPASKLKYDLISGPSKGKLVLLPEKVPITYFTQADIDENRLVYIHDGVGMTDSFHFRIWDGKFRPEFYLFNIMITPINLTISTGLAVHILQGSDVVFLSKRQFLISTNANRDKITFSLKSSTKHGVLYKDNPTNPFYKDKPLTSFTYLELVNEKVMYLQTDMTTANDSFKVFGEISVGNQSFGNEIEVIIKVKPFMHIHNFTTKAGETNRLSLHILDATPLAKLTNSNPRYTIVVSPKNGKIRKIIRSSGEKRNVLDTVVTSFTHEEVQSGLIFMETKDIEVPWDGVQDNMYFILAASIFQPAIGELKINIKSAINNEVSSTLAGPSDPSGHEGSLHLATPSETKDYLLIVSGVVGVVIVIIAIVVIIKCRSLNSQINKEEQCAQPLPLPRPPDRFVSTSPSPKPSSEGYTVTMTTALPQCKVTPLTRSEADSPSIGPCYPYGTEELPDDWSSIDASDVPSCPTKNIMLRRNQYWV